VMRQIDELHVQYPFAGSASGFGNDTRAGVGGRDPGSERLISSRL